MTPKRHVVALICAMLTLVLTAAGADWPTYRYDAERSACSADSLPAALRPAWSVKLPAFQPAFPNEKRQQFDRSYEPVCADGRLVVGSPVDGSVRAYSAVTGEQVWITTPTVRCDWRPCCTTGMCFWVRMTGRFVAWRSMTEQCAGL